MKVLIAYNNDASENNHLFFETCADEVKQCCLDNNIVFTPICPPNLDEQHICQQIDGNSICFLASHGDCDGVYNENGEPVVSVRTNNYNFSGKMFYSVACNCAQKLMPELKRLGLTVFVGYNDEFRFLESDPAFYETALDGLKCILTGRTIPEARESMFAEYTKRISESDSKQTKMLLLHNREHLCFE